MKTIKLIKLVEQLKSEAIEQGRSAKHIESLNELESRLQKINTREAANEYAETGLNLMRILEILNEWLGN
jgi:hypothetical protein